MKTVLKDSVFFNLPTFLLIPAATATVLSLTSIGLVTPSRTLTMRSASNGGFSPTSSRISLTLLLTSSSEVSVGETNRMLLKAKIYLNFLDFGFLENVNFSHSYMHYFSTSLPPHHFSWLYKQSVSNLLLLSWVRFKFLGKRCVFLKWQWITHILTSV